MSGEVPGHESVAILGAGSLGRLWGGYLPTGHAFFISRNPSDSKDSTRALLNYRLRSPEGEETACCVAVRPLHLSPRPGLLIVTTKAGDTLEALQSVVPSLNHNVPIVLFQNGMGSQQAVASHWPERPILAASTTEGANRPDAETLVHAGRGQTWIGGLNTTGRQSMERAVRFLSPSRLHLLAETDIHRRLWDKLVVNAGINAFTVILDCPNGDILSSRYFLNHIDALSEEIADVMATNVSQPLSATEIKARIHRVATSTAQNTSSMRSDYQRGRKTEIDVINGYIIDRGRDAGIPAPVNQMLTQKVKDLTEF